MVLQWIVGLFVITALVFTGFADHWCSKAKSLDYFEKKKISSGKGFREANIPDSSEYDSFYSGLNAR
ncbi:hypothetical protein [Desulfitobacterium sp.]|uniref:hypothetical protein n=1 Tax=Desulfitobacterium sp. TaxID=49981 RepID=UPI002C45DA8D|nr:hypothetical protein [Desulfitobacterium sp.]HVJ48690.1 hypothetical protein [Desulfitobacterium sp.]